MAQRTVVTLVDDLDGSDAEETLTFALDDVDYEIDLNPTNADHIRGVFADYVAHARPRGPRRTLPGPTAAVAAPTTHWPPPTRRRSIVGNRAPGREENRAVRDWAHEHGYKISKRGRIPSGVHTGYNARTTTR